MTDWSQRATCPDALRKAASALVENRSIPEPTTGCWLWERGMSKDGYGHVEWQARGHMAHRLSYFGKTGEWPRVVRHRCDNPSCVNPEHLLGGTALDNKNDSIARGRHAFGVRNGHAKLTDSDVVEIRALAGKLPQRAIAAHYGVNNSVVCRTINGVAWAHVGRPAFPAYIAGRRAAT